VNRCDYRRYVSPEEAGTCRDANERHGLSFEDGCEDHASIPFEEPVEARPDACWTVSSFADPDSVASPGDDNGDDEGGDDEDEGDDENEEDEDEEGDEYEEDAASVCSHSFALYCSWVLFSVCCR